MIQTETNKWYALYTNPRAEKKLSKILDKYKIENYLPLLQIQKKWTDRFKVSEFPLFASYIFLHIRFFESKNKILGLPGAHHFVFHKGEPCEIPDEDIKLIKLFVEKYPDTLKIRKEESLQKGKKVFISRGPFAGYQAEVQKVKNEAIVIVRLPQMNSVVTVQVKTEDIGFDEI
ncbi:MAG: UpxY family transcription antiterminator [Leptospira sp.]|nr:UpxY family transcription antiterminator [Leptospira sp.]